MTFLSPLRHVVTFLWLLRLGRDHCCLPKLRMWPFYCLLEQIVTLGTWGCSNLIYDSWMHPMLGYDLVCAHWTWVVTSMRCLDKVVIYVGCWMLGQSYDSCGMLVFRLDLVGMLISLLWLVSFEPISLIFRIVLHLALCWKFTMFLLLYYYASWKFIYSCNFNSFK